MAISPALKERVLAWQAEDPDPTTQAELQELLDAGSGDVLEERFSGMIQFGTAGLRGLLGAGPQRMNRCVVQRATAGFCRYLIKTVPDAKERGICIGYDARRMSREFAEDVAGVVAGHGIVAHLFEEQTPTPLVGFAVLDLNAAGGVVITASHNPPDYNGYKVFWGNGAQIITPHDEGIAAEIEAIETLASIEQAPKSELIRAVSPDVKERYLVGVQKAQRHPELPRDLTIAYTAMHGVGGACIKETFKRAGYTTLYDVASQAEPDGMFPTVSFPNPEEDGAMDLVLETAAKHNADLVLANDPDADRLAASVLHDGKYVVLTGNEIGCLLTHYLLENSTGDDRLVLCSVVSSPMLLSIGKAHNVRAEQTLTGHKWVQNRSLELEAEGYRYIFGFEEALGYGIDTLVRDKDGISAALCLADMAVFCKSQGKTLVDELEVMARRYGLFLSDQISIVLPGADGRAQIEGRMQAARENPPKSLGGKAIIATQDFQTGKRITADGDVSDLTFPPANVVLFELEGNHRAMLRPSGTEPKIKHYIDVCIEIQEGESIGDARARGEALVAAIAADFAV